MKRLITVLTICACVAACTTQQIQTLGPIVAQVALERIAHVVLKKNPSAGPTLRAIADSLDAIRALDRDTEIAEKTIRDFVELRKNQWGLTESEAQLVVTGLLETRNAYLANANTTALRLSDPNVLTWVSAVQAGLRAGADGVKN